MSSDTKAAIDSLSADELQYEVNLGARSRFQGEKFAYLKARKELLNGLKADIERVAEQAQKRREFRLTSISTWIAIVCSVLSLVVGGGWYQEREKNARAEHEANERLIAEYLQPIATMLADNDVIFQELRAPPYVEPGWGILESYLMKIRRDGVPKHAVMKQRIETLVANNQTVITLLGKYAAYAKTPQFQSEAAKFRDHALRYNDRWKSLLEVYAAEGEFPTAAPVFPNRFPATVQAELAVRR